MKKITLLMVIIVVAVMVLGACSTPVQEQVVDTIVVEDTPEVIVAETDAPAKPDFTNFTTVTTTDVLDFPMQFTVMPDEYKTYETEYKGTDLVIHYTTDVYENDVVYEKYCRVYLPYGYDANDKDKKYNVMYFQHGNNGTPNYFFDNPELKRFLDNIFDPEHGVMEPCIIVCPTYYLEYDETSFFNPGIKAAGDGRYEGIKGNYYLEVVEDLIPAVESQLNVYCDDFSKEGIIASRDHRAWTGYSRGSVCTWYMFHNDFEYFRYWMPVSAQCLQEDVAMENEEAWSDEEAFLYLKETIDKNADLPFFIFAASGGPEDAQGMRPQMKYFIDQTDTFSYGLDPSENNIYYTCSEYEHAFTRFPYYLYNARNVLFN